MSRMWSTKSRATANHTRHTYLPLVLLVLAVLVLFRDLLAGKVLFWGLPSLQFYPWRSFAFDELRAGRLPAWNPYVGAGAPLLANYQTAVFYPPNWFHLLLPHAYAMSMIALLHVLWAGIGMWQFTGALKLENFGRGVSMLSYALGGYLIARFGSFPTASAGAWIPWIFWLVHRAITRQRREDVGWLGLAFGLQLLAGHAQTTWYGCVGVGLYALWLVGWHLRAVPLRRRAAALLRTGAGIALGVLVATVQLIPTAEYLAESQRSGGLDYASATNLSYNIFRLVTLFSPHFYGTPTDGSYITKGIYFEDAAYIGYTSIILALIAVAALVRLRHALADQPRLTTVPFWTTLFLASLLVATGRYGPIFHTLYTFVPTFDAFREPVRWLILVVFSLSMLAGIGVSYWERGQWVAFWSRLAAAGGGAMSLMALGFLEFGQPDNQNLEVLAQGIIVLGAWTACTALLTLVRPDPATGTSRPVWQAAVLLFITIDLVWAGSGMNPTVPPEYYDPASVVQPDGRLYWFEDYRDAMTFGADDTDPPTWGSPTGYFNVSDYRIARDHWQDARASLLPNLNMLDRVPALNNNDPFLPATYDQYIDLVEDLIADAGPLLRAAGVSRTYGIQPDGWDASTSATGELVAESPASTTPFAWLVSDATWLVSEAALEDALRDPAWDPAQTVFLDGADQQVTPPATAASGEITLLEERPGFTRYRVETDAAAYLVISQTWYPGWSATLDGQATRLYRANLAFQAVAVPPGESEVVLRYDLRRFELAASITGLGLTIVAGLIVAGTRRQQQKSDD